MYSKDQHQPETRNLELETSFHQFLVKLLLPLDCLLITRMPGHVGFIGDDKLRIDCLYVIYLAHSFEREQRRLA